jgi:hypothetical protein
MRLLDWSYRMTAITESNATNVLTALRSGRPRAVSLLGQIDQNQGRATFTGRLTLDQFCDLTVVHNRKWAEGAGVESLDVVTQREIIDAHASGLAAFTLQGLVAATASRAADEGFPEEVVGALARIQDRVGRSAHYGLPPVTLVMQEEPELRLIKDEDGSAVAARMVLVAGKLLLVADGQHRREAARRVREFLHHVIGNRRTPKGTKFYPAEDAPLTQEEVEAWIAVQETFRALTVVSYEAHLALNVGEARQLFTNYNCHVRPVKADLNLEFDQSNPLNAFGKSWVTDQIKSAGGPPSVFDLRELAAINGFVVLGKTSIKQVPYDVSSMLVHAREFWTTILSSPEWKRDGTLLQELAVMKGLAKAWFMVFLARRNAKTPRAAHIRQYLRSTRFDDAWKDSIPGLRSHVVSHADGSWRFSPAHNDIVGLIVKAVVG